MSDSKSSAGSPAHFRRAGMVETEFVAEFLRRQADGGIARGQTMDGKPFDDPNGHRLVGLFGKRALDLVFEGCAAFDDGFHLWLAPGARHCP
jgi:hypothetical protein